MPNNERTYADLLFKASRKYASWDPEVPVEVGDWGSLTRGSTGLAFWKKDRGIFLKEGNIYTDGTAEKYELPKPVERTPDSTEGVTWIVSDNAKEISMDAAVGGQTPALAKCNVKAAFDFSSGIGAALVMDNDTISTIDPPGCLRRLLEEETMKGRVIVSEVHRTASYARLLTSKSAKSVAIGLSAEPPVANTVSAKVDAKWTCSSNVGNFKSKVIKERKFTPLFRLVSLKEGPVSTGFRDDNEEGDPPLPDAEPEWNDVGKNGKK